MRDTITMTADATQMPAKQIEEQHWKDHADCPSSFRDGPKDQTRNLEIPGCALHAPDMTWRYRKHHTLHLTGTARRFDRLAILALQVHHWREVSPCNKAPRGLGREFEFGPSTMASTGQAPGQPAINALHHVDVVAHGAAGAVLRRGPASIVIACAGRSPRKACGDAALSPFG